MNGSYSGNTMVSVSFGTKRGVGCWGICVLFHAFFLSFVRYADAAEEALIQFDIPQQRADAALTSFAQQADITVIYRHDLAKKHNANRLVGKFALSQAASELLLDSGLRAVFDERGHLTIVETTSQETAMKSRSWIATALATVFSMSANGADGDLEAAGEIAQSNVIDVITVTATKRSANIQTIPASITALSEIEIERRGLVSMDDYLSTIPGVNMADRGVSTNKITMRGVNASIEEDSTVGVFFGEVPLNTVSRGSTADMKMVDVTRVEVLRGPQGTLFGSGSMGGAVRNIPNAPNLDQLEGKFEIGYSNTADAGSDNYSTYGVINLPLIEGNLALRLVGYNYDYSGYVDNIGGSDPEVSALAEFYGASAVDKYGVGGAEFVGSRASLLWAPTDNLSVTLMYANQDLDQDGETEVNLSKGGYANVPMQIGNLNGGDEQKTSDLDLTNLTIEYDLGWASLLSSTSSIDHVSYDAEDLSKDFGFSAAQTREHRKEAFVQEVRMTSQWDSPWQAIAGIYYEELEQNILSDVPWTGDPATITETPFGDFLGTDPDDIYHQDDLFTLEQTAVFGELSYQFNDQWQALIGGRWFDYNRRKIENQTGVFSGGGIFEDQTIKEDGSTFKANLSYTPNDSTLVYAQWAQGFRVGRPITPVPAFCDSLDASGNPGSDGFLDGTNIPVDSDSVQSDSLDSIEVGGKFNALNNRLQANVSLYYIDWSGIPVSVFAEPHCGFAVTVNAGKASILGGEVETTYYLSDGLRLEVGLAYIDGELAEDNDSLGAKGTRLPGSSKFKGNLGLQYEFEFSDRPTFARLNYAHVGSYHDYISADTAEAGGYNKLDARAGIALETVELEIYASNLLNEDAITQVLSDPVIAYQLRPRTIGIDMRFRF